MISVTGLICQLFLYYVHNSIYRCECEASAEPHMLKGIADYCDQRVTVSYILSSHSQGSSSESLAGIWSTTVKFTRLHSAGTVPKYRMFGV